MGEKRNIIPVILEVFDFGDLTVKDALTGKLASLNGYNGMSLVAEYVEAGFEKLRNRFLNVAIEDIYLHTLAEDAKEITETQMAVANQAPSVEIEQLTAQEWFERGTKLNDNSESEIRCYTEAIKLDPNFAIYYMMRGSSYGINGKFDDAILDFDKAIDIDKNDSDTYFGRALIHDKKLDFDSALADYNKAVDLNVGDARVYINRALIFEKKKDYSAAIVDYEKYLELGGGEEYGDQKEWEEKIKNLESRLAKKRTPKKKSK